MFAYRFWKTKLANLWLLYLWRLEFYNFLRKVKMFVSNIMLLLTNPMTIILLSPCEFKKKSKKNFAKYRNYPLNFFLQKVQFPFYLRRSILNFFPLKIFSDDWIGLRWVDLNDYERQHAELELPFSLRALIGMQHFFIFEFWGFWSLLFFSKF